MKNRIENYEGAKFHILGGNLASSPETPDAPPGKVRWVLTFKAEGDGPPVECRVRRLLKAALRAYGLRCLDHRIIGDGGNARDFGASACLDVSEVGRQSAGALPLESGPATATPAATPATATPDRPGGFLFTAAGCYNPGNIFGK